MNDKLLKDVILDMEILEKHANDLEEEVTDLEKLIELKEKYLNRLKLILETSENK